jgi:hypothetical protein
MGTGVTARTLAAVSLMSTCSPCAQEHDQAALLGEVMEAEAQLAATKQAAAQLRSGHSQGPGAGMSAGASTKGGLPAPAPASAYHDVQAASAAGGLQQYLAPQGALCTMLGDPGEEEPLVPGQQHTVAAIKAKGNQQAPAKQVQMEAAGGSSHAAIGGPVAPQTPESNVTARISDRDRRLKEVPRGQGPNSPEIAPVAHPSNSALPSANNSHSLYATAKAALQSLKQQVSSLWGTTSAPRAVSVPEPNNQPGQLAQAPQHGVEKQSTSQGGLLGLALSKAEGGGSSHSSGQLRDIWTALLVAACVIALYKERKVSTK